jgi:hypothetical protein
MEQDISREGISTKKITHTVKVMTLKRYTDALIFANTFSDIDFDELFSK